MEGSVTIDFYNASHGVIYEAYPADSIVSTWLVRLAFMSAGLGLILFSVYLAPWLNYWATSENARYNATSEEILATAKVSQNFSLPTLRQREDQYQPLFDPRLSKENVVKIPSIGVSSNINEASYGDFEEALKKGVWRTPSGGTPDERNKPVILAAHRFGYLSWSNFFRRQNSFYSLPKLTGGDIVEIDWHQRKYLYEVFAESRGDAIADIPADLILYTCESLSGPIRIVKYARLLEV